jgi:FdhD protein
VKADGKILKKVTFMRGNHECTRADERIIRETAFTINVNGRPFITAMLMATLEKEFVYGNLFTSGIIGQTWDVTLLPIKNNTADVTMADKRTNHQVSNVVRSDLKVKPEDIFTCVRAILKSDIFSETEAVHSAGLFLEGKEPICITEDLGRHHALDKVIGDGLLKNIDFSRTLAASTGRQPAEMITKCRHAGIPIIATKGVPTTLAVEMAGEAGITIAGLVRGTTMTVYSHPERIEGYDAES